MEENNKLNKKLVIEKPLPTKKSNSGILLLLMFLLIIGVAIAFIILEKMNYIDYLDFI